MANAPAGPPAWMAIGVLALAIGAVYGSAVDAPFIFDDNIGIMNNESIVSLWPLVGAAQHSGPLNPAPDLPSSRRPLVNLSLAVNYYFGGLNPLGYHVFSVVVHFGSTLLLWAIVRRTLRLPCFAGRFDSSAGWLALVAALLWALHPLQTETVIYATQRTELMMAFFYLATLYCSLRVWAVLPLPVGAGSSRWRRSAWLVLAVLACLAGMASKEVMVSAPLMVLLFDRTFVAGSLAKALRRSWPLYAGLAATWIPLFWLTRGAPHGESAGFGFDVSPIDWWLTQTQVFWLYWKLVVWPSPLLIHYQLPYLTTFGESWMYVVPLLLLGLATLVLLWRNYAVGFLGTWVFAILSPTFVVPILTEMAAERRMYLPLAAVAALVVIGGYAMVQRSSFSPRGALGRRLSLATIGVPGLLLAVVFGLASAGRLAAYHNEFGLWQDVLQHQPKNHIAHQNLGFYLDKAGKVSEAIDHYREALRLKPEVNLAYYNLGLLLLKTNATAEAVINFEEAARRLPNNARVQNNLAAALFMSGSNDKAIDAFRRTLELDPTNWSAKSNLGMALQKAGRYGESIEAFEQALRMNAKALDIYSELANTYALQNQRQKAIAALEHGLELARAAGDEENTKRFTERLDANR